MPCNSDYLEPSQGEKNLAVIYGLLDELQTGQLPQEFGRGTDPRAYNKANKKHLDDKTEELCSKLQTTDVTKYSLEMQMWWRDHQRADKERVDREFQKQQTEEAKRSALSKLTDYERRLLGL
jgi:hypothetical protein